jgi:hypothetical protein
MQVRAGEVVPYDMANALEEHLDLRLGCRGVDGVARAFGHRRHPTTTMRRQP